MLPHLIDGDKPLVGVNLTGGLGNQMFQYAAGLALAERVGARLLCDCYFYAKPAGRRPQTGTLPPARSWH